MEKKIVKALSHKKKKNDIITFVATWMNLEIILLSQTEKGKHHVISKNMIQMNLFIKQKKTHRHRKQTYGHQRGKTRGGIILELGINRHELPYIK